MGTFLELLCKAYNHSLISLSLSLKEDFYIKVLLKDSYACLWKRAQCASEIFTLPRAEEPGQVSSL